MALPEKIVVRYHHPAAGAPPPRRIRRAARGEWVPARELACGQCENQILVEMGERCAANPDLGCLGRARAAKSSKCPLGRWI